MKVSYEQVKAFVAVADTGSFSAAGKLLGKHRTTLGQAITSLEIDVDVTLFDRSGRYPVLTEQGHKLYQQAKALAVASSAFEQLCLYESQEVETELKVYYSEQIPKRLIADAMKALRARYAQVRVHWLKGTNAQVLASLENNESDLAIVVRPNGDSITSIDFSLLFSMQYIVCASPSFIKKSRPSSMADLQHWHQLVLTDYYHSSLAPTICTSNQVEHYDSITLLLSMLEAGEGWTILPKHFVEDAIENRQFEELSIQELNGQLHFPVVGWQASKSMGPVASYLMDLIKQESKRLS